MRPSSSWECTEKELGTRKPAHTSGTTDWATHPWLWGHGAVRLLLPVTASQPGRDVRSRRATAHGVIRRMKLAPEIREQPAVGAGWEGT